MRILTAALAFTLLMLPTAFVYARGGADGGGGGVGARCSGQLELLDRHEARFETLAIAAEPKSESEAVALTADLLGKHFWNPETVKNISEVLSNLMIEPFFKLHDFELPSQESIHFNKVTSLPLSDDIAPYKLAAGCSLEQIIYFDDRNHQINIVESRWSELSWLDKSMLVTHELAYLMNRREGLEALTTHATTLHATQTRLFIRRLYSTTPPTPTAEGIPAQPIACYASHYDSRFAKFYLYNQGGRTTAVFYELEGHASFYQLKGELPLLSPQALTEGSGETSDKVTLTIPEGGELNLNLVKLKGLPPTLEVFRDGEAQSIGGTLGLQCEVFK